MDHFFLRIRFLLQCLGLATALFVGSAWAQGTTNFAMVGLARGQTLQLNLVAFPPDPCVARLAFQDGNGIPVGPSTKAVLAPGESASISLNGNLVVSAFGQRVEVLPIVLPDTTAFPPDPCHASAEVFDSTLGITTTVLPGTVGFPPDPAFGLLGLTVFDTMRIDVVAYPSSRCIGTLNFTDSKGNPVGPTGSVDLAPGKSAFLDLPGSSLVKTFGQRVEIHPLISQAVGAPTACVVSIQNFNTFTARTGAYYPPGPCDSGDTSCEVF